jgi:hypothetical protein
VSKKGGCIGVVVEISGETKTKTVKLKQTVVLVREEFLASFSRGIWSFGSWNLLYG